MIIITPGHYKAATGAKNRNGFSEYPETRLWAKELVACIGEKAIYVSSQPLTKKVRRINRICGEKEITLALEIHFNSAKNSAGTHVGEGSETLYYPGSIRGRELAVGVQGIISSVFSPDRGVKEGWYRRRKTSGALYFLEHTRCPAIIIEPEFIQYQERITRRRDELCEKLGEFLQEL